MECPLAAVLAGRLREARAELTTHWLERIASRVTLSRNSIFPADDLLDHVPLLLLGIADYLEDPAQVIGADAAVVDKARELGELRHAQGFDAFEILKEYEILGGILFTFLSRIVDGVDEPCTRAELVLCTQRVFHAIALIQEATATQFLQRMAEKVAEREERLRAFNRALTHEFRNRIGAARGAGQLLEMADFAAPKRQELARVVVRSTGEMQGVLDNLLELSRVGNDVRQQRHVRLPEAAAEAARQLREMAHAHGVELRLAPDLPDVEVSAAAVELCLTNLIANGIKYADPAKEERWVEVRGHVGLADAKSPARHEVVVQVRDNGLGVPEAERSQLFQRFFRSDNPAVASVGGTGLGLSIVRHTVEDLGGRVWTEFPAEGAVFALSLPCRRRGDQAADTRA